MLPEKIRSVAMALGEMAGRVNSDDWNKLSALRDELASLANAAAALESTPAPDAPAQTAKGGKKNAAAAKEDA